MNDIEKKLEALKAEFLGKLEELQKEAEEQEALKPWKPKTEEQYFFVKDSFYASGYWSENDEVDNHNFEIGNCFRTEERAEQIAKKMRLLLRLEQLHDMLCPDYEPDWESDEAKFCVYFSYIQNNWRVGSSTSWENPCTAVFDTVENAKKAAEILNKMRESK